MPLDAVVLPRGAAVRQVRAASWAVASIDEKRRTVELAYSSEVPVERWWGIEILDHSPGAMVDDWIAGGTAPVLCDHDPRDIVGVVEAVTLGADRKARAVVRIRAIARRRRHWQRNNPTARARKPRPSDASSTSPSICARTSPPKPRP